MIELLPSIDCLPNELDKYFERAGRRLRHNAGGRFLRPEAPAKSRHLLGENAFRPIAELLFYHRYRHNSYSQDENIDLALTPIIEKENVLLV